MNFNAMKAFLTVANENSIRAAAEAMYLTPQALSEQIRRLENELGVKLMTNTRPATLTACGKRFARYCEETLAQREKLNRELGEISGARSEVVISVPASDVTPLVPLTISRFVRKFPHSKVTLVARTPDMTVSQLQKCDLHLSDSPLPGEFETLTLLNREHNDIRHSVQPYMALVVRRSLLREYWGEHYEEYADRLVRELDFELLRGIPFIGWNNHYSDTNVMPVLKKYGYPFEVSVSVPTDDLCIAMCMAGVGIYAQPDLLLRQKMGSNYDPEKFLMFVLPDPSAGVDLMISYTKGKELSEEEACLIRLFSELPNFSDFINK